MCLAAPPPTPEAAEAPDMDGDEDTPVDIAGLILQVKGGKADDWIQDSVNNMLLARGHRRAHPAAHTMLIAAIRAYILGGDSEDTLLEWVTDNVQAVRATMPGANTSDNDSNSRLQARSIVRSITNLLSKLGNEL